MKTEKLGKTGLGYLWQKIFTLIQTITGDVEVDTKGDLQTQINAIQAKVDSIEYRFGVEDGVPYIEKIEEGQNG